MCSGKSVQCDESFWFKPPKHHRGKTDKHAARKNWCMVIVEEDSTLFHAQMLRKRTRPAMETIINHTVLTGTHIKTDGHKSYFNLGRSTKENVWDPMRPAKYIHSTVNHSKTFKDPETGTHTNKVEGLNGNMKSFYKTMHGIPKRKVSQYIDHLMFQSWTNKHLPFSRTSHSREERDKALNNWTMFIVIMSEFYCIGSYDWEWINNPILLGLLIPIEDHLIDYYRDQGYMEDGRDIPDDDIAYLSDSDKSITADGAIEDLNDGEEYNPLDDKY